jgi:DNA-binding transcriptional LysR family regulator
MTLDQIRIFLEVAAAEHITRAAQALNMTQSAVSSAIQALEVRHATRLFDRIGRRIVLNQTGRLFLPEARAVLAQARTAEAMLNDLAGLKRGTLSIMASQTVGGYWLPPRLVAFRRAHPGVRLDVHIRNTVEAADAVEAGHSEFGIVEGAVDRPALSSEIIAIDRMVIVVAPHHPWATSAPGSAGDLAGSSWVLREVGSGTRLAFDAMMSRQEIDRATVDVAMELPSNEAVLVAVRSGIGATLASMSAAEAGITGGLLAAVDWPPQARPFYLLRHRERYRSQASVAFEDLARQQA